MCYQSTYALLNEAIVARPTTATIASCNVLSTTTVAVDVCVVMRHERKGTRQMIDGGMSNKILPLTELQIAATITMLTQIMNGIQLSPDCEIIVCRVARLKRKRTAPPTPTDDYVISNSHAHPNHHCWSSGEAASDSLAVVDHHPSHLLKHDRTIITSESEFFSPEYRNIGHRSFYPNQPFFTRDSSF